MKITVVIPAYNEAADIAATVAALRAENTTIIVVDDHSTDDTAHQADAAGADVVLCLPERVGKGAALWAGAHGVKADALLFLDADLGQSAGEAIRLLQPIEAGVADLVIGKLPHAQAGGGSGRVVRLAREGILRRTGLRMQAPLSGQRAMSADGLAKLTGFARGFGVEVGMTIDAYRAGLRIMEMDVPLQHRVTGRDLRGRLHRLRQYLDVRAALRERD